MKNIYSTVLFFAAVVLSLMVASQSVNASGKRAASEKGETPAAEGAAVVERGTENPPETSPPATAPAEVTDIPDEKKTGTPSDDVVIRTSAELVRLAWAASSQANYTELDKLHDTMMQEYEKEAKRLHGQLNNFPPRDRIEEFRIMNDVATMRFVRAEAYMHSGESEQAIRHCEETQKEFQWAQAWDPSRGSYWSIAEKCQAVIKMIRGETAEEEVKPVLRTKPKLARPGTEAFIDYTKYGVFHNVGEPNYRYEVKDPKGLSDAAGEGIYPNTGAVLKNPGFRKAHKEGRLEGSHWDFVQTEDLEAAYFKWATASEPWGVKLFYLGLIFERAKMYSEAIKAYHALVVHFPNAVGWTYWQTPWYPAQAAVSKIRHLIREHPELNLQYKWGKIQIENSFDNDVSNDVIHTYPGVLEEPSAWDEAKKKFGLDKPALKLGPVKRVLGEGRVQLHQYEAGHWEMTVDGKPFLLKGVTYAPTKIGQSPDKGTLTNWMLDDFNKNGRIDGPYDAWVDTNLNNQQDPDEPVVGDFQLMKDMGVNTLRLYHQPDEPDKDLLRRMHEEFGFMVIMGDFVGKYTLGSGADWMEGTDYENEQHKKNMMETVRKMVMEFKDEPYILMWALGNENNYGVASNADKKPEAYFKFINEVAKMIKSIDPNHPVALCNGDTLYLDIFAEHAPDVDIYAANVYRGDYGFGSFWDQVRESTDKPAFITEYGAPAFVKNMPREEAEEAQAAYHRGNWFDILENSVGYENGAGNALGGVVFEWLDEWWKNYEPALHDTRSDVIGPFPGGYYYEEWFGIVGQGDGRSSPFLRQPRKAYYTYKELWNQR